MNHVSSYDKEFGYSGTMVIKGRQSLYRPLELQEFKAPRFLDIRHMKVVSLSALLTGRLNPPPKKKKYSWHSFLLEAEWTPVPWGGRKDYVNEKFQ